MKPALLTTPLNAIGGILCQAQCEEAMWQEEESGFSDQCKEIVRKTATKGEVRESSKL
jgi:hypothetical protein